MLDIEIRRWKSGEVDGMGWDTVLVSRLDVAQ